MKYKKPKIAITESQMSEINRLRNKEGFSFDDISEKTGIPKKQVISNYNHYRAGAHRFCKKEVPHIEIINGFQFFSMGRQ